MLTSQFQPTYVLILFHKIDLVKTGLSDSSLRTGLYYLILPSTTHVLQCAKHAGRCMAYV